MTEKKEYRSAIRSRRLIRQAFLELLKEKRYDKITVTDIVNRADINRSTFYAHYADIKTLAEEIQHEIVDRSMALVMEMDFLELLHAPMPFLRKLFDIADENRELYAILGKTAVSGPQLEKIRALLVEKAMGLPSIPEEIRHQKKFRVRINFFVGGIINVYQQYLVGTMDATTGEILEEIADIITGSSATILDAG